LLGHKPAKGAGRLSPSGERVIGEIGDVGAWLASRPTSPANRLTTAGSSLVSIFNRSVFEKCAAKVEAILDYDAAARAGAAAPKK